ncbi:E3 ubiquitin-protein ligase EL5-like [Phragmites australis]|uniref:E3 ubiquitin-protein ligase EL5-like n=1 Tax=Phragmites australis TaxID=29695 RepID=UPI002D781DCF|nr:E3 ubiquitin-protein ligase EL5-like [Phragmites australis]
MAVTATTVAAAITMLAAVAAVFLTFVLCFYVFLCAKQYRGGATSGDGVAAWLRFMFGGGGGAGGGGGGGADGAVAWCYEGGLDEKSMAKLPRREVGKGEALDCAVCITELAAGETARVLPRCGHGFHVDCVDMWLRSHSTCPLCRCPAVDEPPAPPAVPTPEADPESPNFPTNVLFFGSQDEVSTGRAQQQSPALATLSPSQEQVAGVAGEAARALGLRRLLGCGGLSPPPQPPHHHHHYVDADRDIEMGLAAGESSASRPVQPPQPGS